MNCVYAWCIDHVDPAKREQWEAELSAPLPGQERVVTPFQAADEAADFMATMAMHQARARN